MKILVYSAVNEQTIVTSMGVPEYSYYFVLKEFLPVLQACGEVIVIEDPSEEVDDLFECAQRESISCVFLSFSPPHKTTFGLNCPTIPVFAWEFSSIPTDEWFSEPTNDWRNGLRRCGTAIVHSQQTMQAVKNAMGNDFQVMAVPAPVWDRFEQHRTRRDTNNNEFHQIQISNGVLIDTREMSLLPYIPSEDAVIRSVAKARASENFSDAKDPPPEQKASAKNIITIWPLIFWRHFFSFLNTVILAYSKENKSLLQAEHQPCSPCTNEDNLHQPQLFPGEHRLILSGVVFTSIFNPYDARKNWEDMITAFCAAFHDTEDATLVFKLGHANYQSAINDMLMCIARIPEFKCRIAILHGFLDDADYGSLIDATSFIVNASHGEGQCLPLMEFLSCGIPAIAPNHSGMADYIDESIAFVVESWQEVTAWPHDPRQAYRTLRNRTDWESLRQAYLGAYECRKNKPLKYQAMSEKAKQKMFEHCSSFSAIEKLNPFFNTFNLKRENRAGGAKKKTA